MYKVLIVGLGGSGGKTLGFLMDELKVRLGDEWNGRLPESWKFVHIDVPIVADTMGSNLANSVADQGGSYVGIAGKNSIYSNFDITAMGALRGQNPPALDMAARWRPDPKKLGGISIDKGAGAFRAVGRVVTLAAASNIFKTLKSAVDDMSSLKANEDLKAVGRQVGSSAESEDGKPLVFLVSSLAGGSGASMVLDVADMLRGLTNDSFDGTKCSAFLYTADVFASLGLPSAGPGSLATISELISAMNRQEETWTSKEWEALGVTNTAVPGPMITGRGPHMIFPVGAKSQGTPFGSQPEDVYRGFARMLAPLFIDSHIQTVFSAYVLANGPQAIKNSGDSTGLAKDVTTGKTNAAHFSAWGSSVLTMGRDRYSEYAAQRIAREAINTLVHGFEDQDFLDKKINLQQAVQRYVDSMYGPFLDTAKMTSIAFDKSADSIKLLDNVVPGTLRQSFANSKASELSGEFTGKSGAVTAVSLGNFLKRNLDSVKGQTSAEGLRAISDWSRDVQSGIEDAFLHVASQKGIRVAVGCLKKLRSDLSAIQLDLDNKVSQAPQTLESTLQKGLQSIAKQNANPIQQGGQIAVQFQTAYAEELKRLVFIDSAKLMSPVLGDLAESFMEPLAESAERILEGLDSQLRQTVDSSVTAAYRQAPVALWPKQDGVVPTHFQPAVNEVLIDGVDKFPAFFDAHVSQAVAPIASGQTAEAARQILTKTRMDKNTQGDFDSVVGWSWKRNALGSHPNVNRVTDWQPKELSSVSGRPQSKASFGLKLGWQDIIGHAREWVDLPSCPFRQHSDQGIKSWLDPAETISQEQLKNRIDQVVSKLKEAIKLAAPLVEIDTSAVQVIHGAQAIGTIYSFGNIPLESDSKVVSSIISGWSGQPQSPENIESIKKACEPGQDRSEIFILGQPASPYLPIVFKSLTEPIRNSWHNETTKASGQDGEDSEEFWDWRRARTLRHFVPVSQKHIAAFMQGWIVGRVTGDIQLFDTGKGNGPFGVKVLDPRDEKWVEFPKNLLGVKSLGSQVSAPGYNEAIWNVPPALLESLALAMCQIQGQDLSPIKPYMAVIKLGLTLKIKPLKFGDPVGIYGGTLSPLDKWFNSGPYSGFESQIKRAQADDSETRRTNALSWISAVSTRMESLLSNGVTEDNFFEIDREFELAPETIAACAEVMRELERPDLGTFIQGPSLVPSSTKTQVVGTNEQLPDVEG
jgi:hypothetical protein